MTNEPRYDEDSIRSLKGLEAIRHRATAYVPDTETGGLTHAAKEIIDNAIDELVQMRRAMGIKVGLLRITICRDLSRGTFQLLIRDNGRGIPLGKLVELVTVLHSSGKFDTAAYATSAGLFGLGLTVTAGLSKQFRIVTHRADGTASLLVSEGHHPSSPDRARASGDTGVTVIYEPDPTIFSGIADYAQTGYLQLLELLKKYVFFTQYPIEFRVTDVAAPELIWTLPIASFTKAVAAIEDSVIPLWTSAHHNAEDWVRHYWHVTRPFAWRYDFQKDLSGPEPLKSYHVRLFYVKTEQKGDSFGMINNIPIDALSSNHLSVVYEQVLRAVADRITDVPVKKFVLESYKLPIFIAADAKYAGAQPAGTTKNAFTSAPFREAYRPEILAHLTSPLGAAAMTELAALLDGDIQSRYIQSLSGIGKAKPNMNRLFETLHRPDKFKDAETKNRREAELFLVEGESAGGSVGYDTDTQAIYQLAGKPRNVITYARDHREMLREIMANEIYQDIFRILNYNPWKPDLSALNFGKTLVLADGDQRV